MTIFSRPKAAMTLPIYRLAFVATLIPKYRISIILSCLIAGAASWSFGSTTEERFLHLYPVAPARPDGHDMPMHRLFALFSRPAPALLALLAIAQTIFSWRLTTP